MPTQRLQVTSLAEGLLDASCLDRTLVLVIAGVALDERLADETRHVVAGNRSCRLEGGRGECRQVEPGLVARIASEQARRAARKRQAAREDTHDGRVRLVRPRLVDWSFRDGGHETSLYSRTRLQT